MRVVLSLLFILSLNVYAHPEFVINTRLDSFSGESGKSYRPFIKAQGIYKTENWSLFAEGFAFDDLSDDYDSMNKVSTNRALQEAYVDSNFGDFFVRVGRQSARWSESWVLPSLDIWTARRWHRGFIDPLTEQLIHSDMALISYTKDNYSLDVSYTWNGAESSFPPPSSKNLESSREHEVGGRFSYRPSELNISVVAANLEDCSIYGASLSYALSDWVLKLESGLDSENSEFISIGADGFFDDLTITPQIVYFETDEISPEENTAYYVSILKKYNNWNFETQFYRTQKYSDTFGSVLVSYNFTDALKVSSYYQHYSSQGQLRLFSFYESIWGDVFGLRLDYTL